MIKVTFELPQSAMCEMRWPNYITHISFIHNPEEARVYSAKIITIEKIAKLKDGKGVKC